MALREVSGTVDVLNSGCVLVHSSLIHTSTPIKKIALVAKATRGCYLLNIFLIARRKTCGSTITHTPTQIAHMGNVISHTDIGITVLLAWLHIFERCPGHISLVSLINYTKLQIILHIHNTLHGNSQTQTNYSVACRRPLDIRWLRSANCRILCAAPPAKSIILSLSTSARF